MNDKLVRNGVPRHEYRRKVWSWTPQGARRQDELTDQPTVSCEVTWTVVRLYNASLFQFEGFPR